MKLALALAFVLALVVSPAKAQSTETFTDEGGSCSTHTVSHNGGAAINWVCQAPVTTGTVDAASVSFSVVLNSDGSFTNGYLAFYNSNGQLSFASTNFSGSLTSGVFTGSFSGTDPNGAFFSGNASQILTSRTVVNRYGRHTYYSVGSGSGGDVTFN